MRAESKNNIYTGTSGLVLPLPNRVSFPPEFHDKSRLEIYASLFNSVEINSSFYKIPMASTVQKWAALVPENFKFTFKLWRDITHNKELAFNPADIERFMLVIDHAGNKSGCLLVQFPPKISVANTLQLEKLLVHIKELDPEHKWNTAVEFRNKSWYHEDVYGLVDQYNCGIVLHDMPASRISSLDCGVNFTYLRFHGPAGGYRGSYSNDFLYEYAQYVKEWNRDGKQVYVYFNNTMGDAVRNLATLNKYIEL